MKTPSETLLEASTLIVYSIDRIPADLKIFWSKFLRFYFSDKLLKTQVHQREITAAAKAFQSQKEIDSYLENIDKAIVDELVTVLIVLRNQALKAEEWMAHKTISSTVEKIVRHHEVNLNSVEQSASKIGEEFTLAENPETFSVQGSIFILTLDYLMRWVVIAIGNNFSLTPGELYSYNFIPTVVFIIAAYFAHRSNKKHNLEIGVKHIPSGLFKISTSYSTLQYTLVAFFFASGIFITALLNSENGFGLVLLSFLILTIYYYFLLNIFPIGKLKEENVLEQLHKGTSEDKLDADQNDEAIVQLETQLNAQTGRLEAYVLESALFGALAFSGFLQIIATNLISFADLEQFASSFFMVSKGFVTADWDTYAQHSAALSTKESLFCLVSIETLVCSGLFLAVIASRLRFSDVADNVRTSLSLAKAYNDKEEFLQESARENSQVIARLALLNEKVNENIRAAQTKLKGINPIVAYMVYFRNAGILLFLLVLISSSLFISGFLSWAFIIFGIATVVYFNLKKIRQYLGESALRFQIFFAKYSWQIFLFSLLPGALGFVMSVGFKLPNINELIALSMLLLTGYLFIWFVFMPHYDSRFGDIENIKGESWRSSKYRLVKNIYGIGLLFGGIGLAFKFLGTLGADELMLIGLSTTALLSYAVGFFLSRPKWLGVFCGVVAGTSAVGILFKILHLVGANELMFTGLVAQFIFYCIYSFRRKSFHRIFFRSVVSFSIIAIIMLDFGGAGLLTRFTLMYSHQTLNARPLVNYYIDAGLAGSASKSISSTDIQQITNECDEYIHTYSPQVMTGLVRRFGYCFYTIANANLYDSSGNVTADPVLLEKVNLAINTMCKLEKRFGYTFGDVMLVPDLLIAQGKYSEAAERIQLLLKDASAPEKVRLEHKLETARLKPTSGD